MPRRIESHLLDGPAGQLEALLEEPEEGSPREACLVCHPHPLYGGTMHNKVVHRMARGLRKSGSVVLRFNFRGVSRSAGMHDDGIGEVDDARAALAWLQQRYPEIPYALAGFSFGSRVILRLGCSLENPNPARLIAVGFPTQRESTEYLSQCRLPKFFVQSANDEHGPKAELESLYATVAEPKRLIFIEAADHFFAGNLDGLEEAIANLVL
ncbi:MAG: alpha/beta hydrolase [Bryobacteraceae bacterium]